MTTKAQRQRSISELIAKGSVTSQPQLQKLLKAKGIAATQATVSRDLEELGAVKVRTAGGETAYAIPEFAPERIAPLEQLKRVLAEWVADIHVSDPIVVVRTPPGCAHVVASALDRSALDGLIGTVAGDDTMLCVASAQYGASRLAGDLASMAGLSKPKAKR